MTVEFGLTLSSFPPENDPAFLKQRDPATYYQRMVGALSPEFTTLWVSDHMQFGESPLFEGWTRLTYLAAMFPRFKVGHLVLCQSFRNPALLAKMGATLQHLTGGRFILGLGAGWHEEEYRAYGYEFPSGGTRVAQLSEAIQVIRALWTEAPATFHGEHYAIENAYCEPRPDPVPPILIGTNGRKALRVTALRADGWSWDAPMASYGRVYPELVRACEEVGRDPASVWLTAGADVDFPEDPAHFVPQYPQDLYSDFPITVVGPNPAAAIEMLKPLVDLGVRHIMVSPSSLRTLEQFSAHVAPVIAEMG